MGEKEKNCSKCLLRDEGSIYTEHSVSLSATPQILFSPTASVRNESNEGGICYYLLGEKKYTKHNLTSLGSL